MDLRLFWACAMLCVMTACAQPQSNDIVAEGESPVRVADSYSFTEGPAADAKGDVFFKIGRASCRERVYSGV